MMESIGRQGAPMAISQAQGAILCQTYQRELEDARHQVKRYSNLIFAISIAFALVIVTAAFLLFVDNQQAAAVTAGLGTAASGGGLVFIVKQRSHYEQARTDALTKIEEFCGTEVRQLLAS
jgi:archaellum biogenesis protein FlaJ (TadC family)